MVPSPPDPHPEPADNPSVVTPRRAPWPLVGAVGVACLVLDQLTKWWAIEALGDGTVQPVVGSLRFRLARNLGAAF